MPRRVVVIGAGAAGIMAAIWAAEAGADTLLLERTDDGGRKILISGGGRCNILPARLDETRFVTDSSPNSLKKIVRSWPLAEQIAFFEGELRIPLAEETETGKLFPVSNRARDVRDELLSRAKRNGARLRMDALVTGIEPAPGGWVVTIAGSEPVEADAVVVATGGLSVPKTGSDGRGLSWVSRLGHAVNPTYAALTPLTGDAAHFTALAGVSLTVTLSARSDTHRSSATGGFLFTHRGYSGPSALDVSHVIVRAAEGAAPARLTVRWTGLDEAGWEARFRGDGSRYVRSALRDEMPERLASTLLAVAQVPETQTLAQMRRDERRRLLDCLVRCELSWTGHEGYKKAEVTGGGVDLAEIDPRTMESRKRPGLFLCGEILDAFGPIGGYNFLWAWATGRAAGLGAAHAS